MKWNKKLLAFLVLGMLLASCTEDIVIDLEKGDPMIGVEASFSNELKSHEAILSYTADFYNKDDIRYISGATVYVTDGVDTMYYVEDVDLKGSPMGKWCVFLQRVCCQTMSNVLIVW